MGTWGSDHFCLLKCPRDLKWKEVRGVGRHKLVWNI